MDSLVPIIKVLSKDRQFKTLNFFGGPAKKTALQNRLKFTDADLLDSLKIQSAIKIFSPDLFFYGTSNGFKIEKKILRIAKKSHIPTAAILDFWINYNLRFSFTGKNKMTLSDLPDYILVMDETAKKEMLVEGFPAEKLIITGNPHFEKFKQFPKPTGRASRRIVFIDQHYSELVKMGIHEDMGYNELVVFADLIKILEDSKWDGEILIKFHPGSQDLKRYDKLIKKSKLEICKVKKSVSLQSLLKNSWLVFGMTSVALFEAAVGGKPVLSYQPSLKRELDPLITNRLGLSHFAYNYQELKTKISQLLKNHKPTDVHRRLINLYTKTKATEKVIKFIKSLILNSA